MCSVLVRWDRAHVRVVYSAVVWPLGRFRRVGMLVKQLRVYFMPTSFPFLHPV